jgi:hypothetical protein
LDGKPFELVHPVRGDPLQIDPDCACDPVLVPPVLVSPAHRVIGPPDVQQIIFAIQVAIDRMRRLVARHGIKLACRTDIRWHDLLT